MAGNPAWKKGQSANPAGKKPGTKNKLPRDLLEKVVAIADDLEAKGVGLDACAKEDPKWFFENFVKPILPKKIDHAGVVILHHTVNEFLKEKLSEIYGDKPCA